GSRPPRACRSGWRSERSRSAAGSTSRSATGIPCSAPVPRRGSPPATSKRSIGSLPDALVSRTRSPLPKSGVDRRRWQGATTRNSWRYSEEEQRSQRRRDAAELGDGFRVRDTRECPSEEVRQAGRTSARVVQDGGQRARTVG